MWRRFAFNIGTVTNFFKHFLFFFVGVFGPVANFFSGSATAKTYVVAVFEANFHTW